MEQLPHQQRKKKKLDLTWNCFSILSPREGSSDQAQQAQEAPAAPGEPWTNPRATVTTICVSPTEAQAFWGRGTRPRRKGKRSPCSWIWDNELCQAQEEAGQRENASVPSPAFPFVQQLTYGRTKAPVCLTSPSPKPRISLQGHSLLSPSSELWRTLNIKLPQTLLGVMGLPSCTSTCSEGRLLHPQSSSWQGEALTATKIWPSPQSQHKPILQLDTLHLLPAEHPLQTWITHVSPMLAGQPTALLKNC